MILKRKEYKMSRLIAIIGHTCTGKSTLAKKFEETGFKRIVPYTTRKPRKGEVDGEEYHFISKDRYLEIYDQLAESALYETEMGIAYYGTMKKDYDISEGESRVVVLNPKAIGKLYLANLDSTVIFLTNARKNLMKLAEKRGDSRAEVLRRLSEDEAYLKTSKNFSTARELLEYDMSTITFDDIVLSNKHRGKNTDHNRRMDSF